MEPNLCFHKNIILKFEFRFENIKALNLLQAQRNRGWQTFPALQSWFTGEKHRLRQKHYSKDLATHFNIFMARLFITKRFFTWFQCFVASTDRSCFSFQIWHHDSIFIFYDYSNGPRKLQVPRRLWILPTPHILRQILEVWQWRCRIEDLRKWLGFWRHRSKVSVGELWLPS